MDLNLPAKNAPGFTGVDTCYSKQYQAPSLQNKS
jgi:hypothetical protein